MAVALSALEVAALVELDEGKIRKDVEHGLFDAPRFSIGDLVYFRLLALLNLQVSVDDRRRLHSLVEGAIRKKPPPAQRGQVRRSSGSDSAGLRTTARREGDKWVLVIAKHLLQG